MEYKEYCTSILKSKNYKRRNNNNPQAKKLNFENPSNEF